ncbi:15701_t:CDS:10, partial [Acaulospora morrowiae]
RSQSPKRRGSYSDAETNDRVQGADEYGPDMYRDEDDRDRLENLNELEREKILSERAEKRQHNKDLEAVHLLFNPDDVGSTRRSMRAKGPKKKGRDLEELKRRRAQKGQRTQTGSQSPEPGEHVSSGDEEEAYDSNGERSKHDTDEIKLEDIKSIQLTRRQLSDWMFAPHFEKTVIGCFVRLHIGVIEGKQIYRLCEIEAVEEIGSTYYVEKAITNRVLRLRHGDAIKVWHMHVISNNEFDASEFERWVKTMKTQNLDLPTKEKIERKKEDLKFAKTYVLSEQDVEAMVRNKQALRGGEPIDLLTQKTTLVTQKSLAKAQGNFKEAQDCDMRLNEIDKMIAGTSRDTKQDIWARVNERNRLKDLEDSRLAEELARQKKKAEIIPRKSIKTSALDSPSSKEIMGERSSRYTKATSAPFTKYEALIYQAEVELKLPLDPIMDYDALLDSEYEAKYALFSVEKSLSLIRGLPQQSPMQQQPDAAQPQQLTPPSHEETNNNRYHRAQAQPWSTEVSKGPKSYLFHKDLHYGV